MGMAQCAKVMSLHSVLQAIVAHLSQPAIRAKLPPSRLKQICDHMSRLQDLVLSLTSLDLDETEFAHLKVISLFSYGEQLGH